MTEHARIRNDGSVEITYDPPESSPYRGELGLSVPINPNADPSDVLRAMTVLHEDARKCLTTGTVYDLRARADLKGMAWYHVPAMKDWSVTDAIPWPGKPNPLGGYIQLGTFRTP